MYDIAKDQNAGWILNLHFSGLHPEAYGL